jgi:predicted  nucleic acid-binding Zn-ribbon protein
MMTGADLDNEIKSLKENLKNTCDAFNAMRDERDTWRDAAIAARAEVGALQSKRAGWEADMKGMERQLEESKRYHGQCIELLAEARKERDDALKELDEWRTACSRSDARELAHKEDLDKIQAERDAYKSVCTGWESRVIDTLLERLFSASVELKQCSEMLIRCKNTEAPSTRDWPLKETANETAATGHRRNLSESR